MLDEDVTGLEDVLAHHDLRPLAVGPGERLHELEVVVVRRPYLLGRVPDVGLVDERQRDDLPHHARQAVALGGREDRLVEARVLVDDGLEVVAADERREPVAARPELVELLRGDA